MREGIDHETFIIPGVVDQQVVHAQAERRLLTKKETTHVHQHKEGAPCNMHCRIYKDEEGMKL